MTGTNPASELDGLLVAFTAAVSGAISRPVTVRNRDVDGFWQGTWPLVILRLYDFNLGRISGGQTGLKGQQGREQNYYSIEIRDVINTRTPVGERVGASQSDLYAIVKAIVDYFDHLPNQSLPVGGYPTCYKAGEYIRFRSTGPFRMEEGGDVQIVMAGVISVIGTPRPGSAT